MKIKKYIVWKISTFGNVPGDKSKILAEDEKNYYYNDGFGRYCYVEKIAEGKEFEIERK